MALHEALPSSLVCASEHCKYASDVCVHVLHALRVLRCVALRRIGLHCIALHCARCGTLRYVTLRFVACVHSGVRASVRLCVRACALVCMCAGY